GDVARDQPVIAPIAVNGGIGGDVSDVVGAVGPDAEEIAAVLGDVDVEIALLIVVAIQICEGEDDVIKIWRAISLFVFGNRENICLRSAAAGLVEEITIGATQGAAELACLADAGIDGEELVEAIVAVSRIENWLERIVFLEVRNE